ncbi:hypothetical protein Igag_1674 [Ignisphaera aggregans DSM 17230]|uniref:Uncharacterized protein n=1 Tax=Ignisphaera aggregans (strain DSM 17230 / JCM 13409 / AQ1.S1) TaxID=583356 RepID=E0SRU0_IGNAA|nr:hypothetical protein Igag_1674 [Ignisphaera aggregans DSM 17230]
MKLFLDSYYFYSWVRLLLVDIRKRIRRRTIKVESILFFEDLQLRTMSLETFRNKIIHILQHRIINELYIQTVVKRRMKRIDLLDILNRGINDEQIPLIEYLLIADDNGKVNYEDVSGDVIITIDDRIRRRIANLVKFLYPQLSPFKYREYLITKVEKILGIPIERELQPTPLIRDVSELINDIEKNLCSSAEARERCRVVRELKTIRNHSDDVVLTLAIATYTKNRNIPILVIPKLPINYECFHHTIKYIREKENLKNNLIIVE